VISNAKVVPATTSKANTPPNKVILDIGYSVVLKVALREKFLPWNACFCCNLAVTNARDHSI
jgi:hypothetical protein